MLCVHVTVRLLVIPLSCILLAFDVVYHTWGMASDMSDRGVTSDMSDISSASDKDEDLDERVCCLIKYHIVFWSADVKVKFFDCSR